MEDVAVLEKKRDFVTGRQIQNKLSMLTELADHGYKTVSMFYKGDDLFYLQYLQGLNEYQRSEEMTRLFTELNEALSGH